MFYDFPYLKAGFKEEEWEEVPRTDKVIIKAFYMNEGDLDQTMLSEFYETDRKVRGAVKTYGLFSRPFVQVKLADLHIPFCNPVGSPRWS